MPYRSRAQAAYFHIHKKELEDQGVDVSEWDRATKGKKLREHVKKKGVERLKKKAREYLRGGEADGVPDSDFNKKDLAEGTAHEMEHVRGESHACEMARETAKDHLLEHPDYYRKLEKIFPEKKAAAEKVFLPDFTPEQLKEMGVYGEVYGPKTAPRLASLAEWPEHWYHPADPHGWLQWYRRYSEGRRMEDDERQIGRWRGVKARHGGPMFQRNPTPRRAFALRNWAIDPLKLVDDPAKLEAAMNEYKNAKYKQAELLEKVAARFSPNHYKRLAFTNPELHKKLSRLGGKTTATANKAKAEAVEREARIQQAMNPPPKPQTEFGFMKESNTHLTKKSVKDNPISSYKQLAEGKILLVGGNATEKKIRSALKSQLRFLLDPLKRLSLMQDIDKPLTFKEKKELIKSIDVPINAAEDAYGTIAKNPRTGKKTSIINMNHVRADRRLNDPITFRNVVNHEHFHAQVPVLGNSEILAHMWGGLRQKKVKRLKDLGKNLQVSGKMLGHLIRTRPARFGLELSLAGLGSAAAVAGTKKLKKILLDSGSELSDKPIEKTAGIIDSIKSLLNPNYNKALYGKRVADLVRRKGMTFMEPVWEDGAHPLIEKYQQLLNSDNETLRALGRDGLSRLTNPELMAKSLRANASAKLKAVGDKLRNRGFIFSQSPSDPLPKGIRGVRSNSITPRQAQKFDAIEADKVLEARNFKDIGETQRLRDIIKKIGTKDPNKIHKTLMRMYPEGYVAKLQNGQGSLGTIQQGGVPTIAIPNQGAHLGAVESKHYNNMIVQPDKQLKKVNPFFDWLQGKFSPELERSKSQEYRVHVMNGKVVPYGTVYRGNIYQEALESLLPFRTPRRRMLENYAQTVIDKVKDPTLRKGTYGFDVGIDHLGRPQLLETNPSASGGSSGWLGMPQAIDAVEGAVAGRLPTLQRNKRLAWGGGLGLVGLSSLGAKKTDDQKKTSQLSSVQPPIPTTQGVTKTAKSMELKGLIEAKKLSDKHDYLRKNELLRKMLANNPTAFRVDSHLNPKYVGITHIQSGFKIHAPKSVVPSELINPYPKAPEKR